mgnify:CR=1 FL=1
MAKLIDITGKALSGEWGSDDETGTGIPVLRTTNFTNEGIINYDDVVSRKISQKNINEKYLRSGDIIIEKSGGSDKFPVGRVVYFDGPDKTYLFNNFTGVLRVKDQQMWHPRYVFYSLFSNYRRGGTRAFENRTTGLHNLKTDDYVSKYEVAGRDYEEQITICEKLDKIYAIIKYREQEIKSLDDLISARFVEMFGDPLDKKIANMIFADCLEFNPKKSEVKDLQDIQASFVPMECIGTDGSFAIKDKGIIREYYKGYTYFRDGDVLLAKITPCFENGKVAIAENCENGIGFGTTEFHVLRPRKDISNSYWIKYLLINERVHELATMNMSGSAGQKRIQTPFFEKLRIYLPPIELQNQFADFVRATDKLKLATSPQTTFAA